MAFVLLFTKCKKRVLAFNLDKSWRKTMVRQVVKDIYKTKKEYKEPKILDLATGTAGKIF